MITPSYTHNKYQLFPVTGSIFNIPNAFLKPFLIKMLSMAEITKIRFHTR